MSETLLKLCAHDREDVQVISAVLQDSIAPICDMVFQADQKSFTMVVQRLRREKSGAGESERICCAVTVQGVTSAHTHGFNPKNLDQMLTVLALLANQETSSLELVFGGDARIRLELEPWFMAVEDFGEPWPTLCHPCHDETATE